MRHPKLFGTVGLALLLGIAAVVPASAQMPAPRITNDNFAQAWAIGTGSGVSGHTNVGAGTQTGEQLGCGLATMAATAWYSMTVSANSSVVVDTRGSTFDTILAVYTGSSLATLFQVNCNDDISGTDVDSSLQFSAVPGTTYWIQVGGWAGETGTYNVNIARTPTGPAAPINDNFAQAWAIGTGSGVSSHTNVGATTQSGENIFCENTMGATVWYSMTVSANSSVVVDTRGSNFDTILSVYTGSSVGSLTRLACDDDISGTDVDSSAPPFSAVPGTTYWIQVGGYSGETGNNLVINITRTPTGPTTPLCAGVAATILGTAASEAIYGTSGNDVIVARGGNDLIYGYGGNDRICAGPGNDYVYGGAGNDRLYGQGGNDYLFGQAGFDVLRGGPGADTCQTGENVIC